jgi:hypothetical protein
MLAGSSEINKLTDFTFRLQNLLTLNPRHTLEFGAEANTKEKIYDFYGTVESMDSHHLEIESERGIREFAIDDSTIKGAPRYDPGRYVHVYYKENDGENIVTMVGRKIG